MRKQKWTSLFCAALIILTAASCGDKSTTAKSSPDAGAQSTVTGIQQVPIARYYGKLKVGEFLYIYDCQLHQDPAPALQVTIKPYSGDDAAQTLSYALWPDFDPMTITDGLDVVDINEDGNDELFFDLGISGKLKTSMCVAYDGKSGQFQFVDGVDALNAPKVINGFLVSESLPMEVPPTFDKYALEQAELRHVGSLTVYENESQTLYSESKLVNGKMETALYKVAADKIDLTEWGLSD